MVTASSLPGTRSGFQFALTFQSVLAPGPTHETVCDPGAPKFHPELPPRSVSSPVALIGVFVPVAALFWISAHVTAPVPVVERLRFHAVVLVLRRLIWLPEPPVIVKVPVTVCVVPAVKRSVVPPVLHVKL